jgi:hypothetical protein
MTRSHFVKLALLLAALGFAAPPARGAHPPPLPILSARLPSEPFRCLGTGGTKRPSEVFRGRPALLVFADARDGLSGELSAAIEALQQEFAPWLGWGAVLVGQGLSESVTLPDAGGRLRFDGRWTDPDGSWRAAFVGNELPAVVLVNEAGYVTRRQAGRAACDAAALREALGRLVGAGKLKGRAARDFKLEELGSGRLVTLADVATRDFTLLLSLRADCEACNEELGLLERIRQEYRERVTLVAIDHDPLGGPGRSPSSGEGQPRPDLLLRDPELRYAERYALGGVPALVVVNGAGRIVLARQGFLPDEAVGLASELRRAIGGRTASGEETLRFAEFRRIRTEGLALLDGGRPGMAAFFFERALELFPEFHTVQALVAEAHQAAGSTREAAHAYGRYLASEPLPCDRQSILRRIKALAASESAVVFSP